ncbi:MAG: ISAs1 family transposase, partial [Bacteroidales bacterium]|nr:ISAs1 family transposase [Bacteroidales bacterium]
MKKIQEKFTKIKDERHPSYVKHKLINVLIITMCAILCGIDQLEDIVSYGKNKAKFLKKAFGIKEIPSKPTLSRILSMIDAEKVGEIILEIMKENVEELGEIIAVDGKSIRSTGVKDKFNSALQILSAYCTESAVIIGQKSIVQTTMETSYYISSLDETPEKLLQTVREHWKIESMHWLLDVVFSEDECRLKNYEGQKTLNSFRKLG